MMDAKKIALDNMIMEGVSGSHAYGTSTPTSDVDYRGLFVEPELYVRSPFFNIDQWTGEADEDRVLYGLSKFMKLLVDQNPNIIEILWLSDDDIHFRTDVYDYLRSNREYLLSSKAKFTFSGYAHSQIIRIKSHYKWINNPKPIEAPRQTDYMKLVHNFTDAKVFKFDIYNYHKGYRLIPFDGNLYGVYQVDGYDTFDDKFTLNTVYDASEDFFTVGDKRRLPLFIVKFNKSEYNQDKDDWKNYWNWKKNRNEKRSVLEEQFGYDSKHASHCIRLMRMCKEILEDGVVNVKRADAAELLAIRDGKYTYDEILQMAEDYDNDMDALYKKTDLPRTVDVKVASNILMTAQNMWWGR